MKYSPKIKTIAELKSSFFEALDNHSNLVQDSADYDKFESQAYLYADYVSHRICAAPLYPAQRTIRAWFNERRAAA